MRERAIGDLLDALQPSVRALCFRLTRSDADVEDAVQDALLGIYEGIERLRGESRVTTWADRLAVRAATRVRARQQRHPATDHAPDELVGLSPSEVSARDLRRALAKLPVTHATVLALFAVEGLSHQEIAATLDIPEGTVWSRLHTARRNLAALMDA